MIKWMECFRCQSRLSGEQRTLQPLNPKPKAIHWKCFRARSYRVPGWDSSGAGACGNGEFKSLNCLLL